MQFSKNRIERSLLLRKEKGSSLKIKQNKDITAKALVEGFHAKGMGPFRVQKD